MSKLTERTNRCGWTGGPTLRKDLLSRMVQKFTYSFNDVRSTPIGLTDGRPDR